MKINTPEWEEANSKLTNLILPALASNVMGVERYEKENRIVTVKHRMRKDLKAVDTVACWIKSEDKEKPDNMLWSLTSDKLKDKAAEKLGQALCFFLYQGRNVTFLNFTIGM